MKYFGHSFAFLSLCLAIFSFVLGYWTAVPAIICGHFVLSSNMNADPIGKRMAISALVIGYIILWFTLIVPILLK